MDIILVIVFSYLSGSIPFGLILTKFASGQDIRKIGSGNIGATNVFRTGNKFLAVSTLLLDALKGYAPVIITKQYLPELIQLSCLMAFLGHIFPIWIKFKGGKGVATYLGILFALSYGLSFLFIFTWVVVLLIFKYSSISSIFSSMAVLMVTLIKDTALKSFDQNINISADIKLILFIFFILIIFTHKKNISNLINKTEHKIKL
ncbi:MAG: glycerol-3-phosphate 1-O-acyltransferase PlsY [Pelagibacteraceae bacterium]|jgi:glycerol-3-phosphate acyltransferase PlsY|nr:acyl-phosphate glycerol 3-phosphate acyltransferase [Candidatus Pelagibacter sp.]MDP6680515.1 glycerol-3-phosphate 1-O-acyltransferase PlsY [Pelagibacteraceae bacterium]MDP6710095.1 glycerol-3-phosphate 1-O-acyltransferase PlsY [Pelagibacteraceae bacterium]|tara:strand:- start:332 stop:943 length:612 start_codon:yes stop_codon:yes gene_type:complete